MTKMMTLWAKQALTKDGWREDVVLHINDEGMIQRVESNVPAQAVPQADAAVGVLLPAPANCHSHAFQRAMAGMTETRGTGTGDSFWSWRDLMYRFVNTIEPDDVEAIAAFVQMEMLEAGFGATAEFHYLHHDKAGKTYANPAEMCTRIAAGAEASGIGLCLLPVFYEQAGCKGQALADEQKRFANNFEQFEKLVDAAATAVAKLPQDCRLGIAPHSLRAVSKSSLKQLAMQLPNAPIHMHIAEQMAEVDEVVDSYGKRPVEWLLDNLTVDKRWCIVHATHMTAAECLGLAESKAVVGLCPITEANLGDGIFEGLRFLAHGGRFAIGSDSNIRICLAEELRLLEYSQRLQHGGRALLASCEKSTGRTLFEGAAIGGAQACGRHSGYIAPGYLADLLSLDMSAIDLHGKKGDALLDSFIFCGDATMVEHVWSSGRQLVKQGRHTRHEAISARYLKTLNALKHRI